MRAAHIVCLHCIEVIDIDIFISFISYFIKNFHSYGTLLGFVE